MEKAIEEAKRRIFDAFCEDYRRYREKAGLTKEQLQERTNIPTNVLEAAFRILTESLLVGRTEDGLRWTLGKSGLIDCRKKIGEG